VAFAGPAPPSLFNHRFGVDAELLRHQSQDRGKDFSHLWKPPIRPEEEQQDGEGKSIGTALNRRCGQDPPAVSVHASIESSESYAARTMDS
jgi:hypothetical protein